jgi:hypothetical protein
MNPRETHKAIWKKFHVHHYDNLPFEGWWNSTRETLYELWGELGFKTGAEVGVRMGTNAKEIFKRVPGLKLYCVDPWGAYQRVTDAAQDVYYQRCVRKLAPEIKTGNAILMRMFSEDAAPQIPDDSLDFVYLDGDHRGDFVMADICLWAPKVKKGGIISGHDYFVFHQAGVIHAVDSYLDGCGIDRAYITREKAPSWFWVNE